MAHSRGSWQEASDSRRTTLFTGRLERLLNMAAGFLQSERSKRARGKPRGLLWSRLLSHVSSLLPWCLRSKVGGLGFTSCREENLWTCSQTTTRVNINLLMKSTDIFQNKKHKVALFYTFANLCKVWLTRRQWDFFLAASASPWWDVLFWLKWMKKILLHTDMSLEKRGNILIAFSDNCGYSLILHQNLTNGSFLKVTFNV